MEKTVILGVLIFTFDYFRLFISLGLFIFLNYFMTSISFGGYLIALHSELRFLGCAWFDLGGSG